MPSERLNRIFRAEHRVPRAELQNLTPADVRELEAAVAGTAARGHQVRAMDVLVSARGAGATRALARLLASRDQPDTLRAAAASQLGRVGITGEPALLAALGDESPSVVMAAAGALARSGSRGAIDRLAPLAERDDLLGQQAGFARTLIAFRGGVRGHEPPGRAERSVLEVPPRRRARVIRRPLRPEEAVRALADVQLDAPGLQLSPAATTGVECGRERLVVAVDPRNAGLTQPSVAAVVARRTEAQESYALSWFVLAWPGGGDETEVAVFRASGQCVLAGAARREGTRVGFELRSVEGRGNLPVEVRGSVQNGRIVELTGVSSGIRPVRGEPTPE